ncbi:hypothetical protein DSB67_01175 [Vibrio campbellii]|uniref:methyltransferase domain-containing protein n=1 Tax=Vibrio campbellii TaxID=680 RepID=UPI000DE1B1BC|nr:methyltransferase domain-containing protein [Vibrio campbellii]AXB30286.1 hypothetical protein DSB67_01175 [Vibrio campbellii]
MSKLGELTVFDLRNVGVLEKRQRSIPELVRGKDVLTIGCVDMIDVKSYQDFIESGLHQLYNIRKTAKSLVGVDINSDGIDILKEEGFNVHCLDVFNFDESSEIVQREYDVLVLSHVIEHIPNLYSFLERIIGKFKFKEIIIAVPNAYNYYSVLNYFFRKKEVISNDHFYTFSPVTLLKLGDALGLKHEAIWFDREEPKVKMGDKHKLLGLFHSIAKKTLFNNNGDLIIKFVKK